MYILYLTLSLLTELGARDKFLLLRSPSSLVLFLGPLLLRGGVDHSTISRMVRLLNDIWLEMSSMTWTKLNL